LAKLYQSQTNYEQSASYYLRALAIQEQELGKQHPDTIKTIRDYAALLRAMGREGEAVALEARIQQGQL
jgi:Tetratricopeptide repeat